MTKPGTGGSAFPQAWEAYPGMTLRDWFAGQALPMACSLAAEIPRPPGSVSEDAATIAYAVADAMLEARS